MKILIIEDHYDIAANIGNYLELIGHTVDFADNGELGLKIATSEAFDLIILDVNLPKMDGFNVSETLRKKFNSQVPILMLTARSNLADKIKGFHAGAWDYLVKPFALEELKMRIYALSLRQNANRSQTISVGPLKLDVKKSEVVREGRKIILHKACFQILELLMRNFPNIVSRNDLEYLLWGEHPPDSSPLRSHIHELRKKVDKNFGFPMIHTVRGLGFKLSEDKKP